MDEGSSQRGPVPPEEHSSQARGRRFQVILEQLPAIVWTTDTELRFTSSQGAGLPQLGLVGGQVVGMPLLEFFETQDPDFLPIHVHRRALQGEAGTYEFTWKGRVWASHVEPLRDESGQPVGTVGVALDITERKRAEDEVIALNEALTERQAELATYNDLITHDLSNLSMTLLGLVERLLLRVDGTLTLAQEELLRKANRQGQELNRLAENAKLLVRLREDGLPVAQEKAPLLTVVRRVLETIRSIHFDRPFKASVEIPWDLTVSGVPFLENILANLLDNAVRHTAREVKPVVRVLGERVEGERPVRLIVEGGKPPSPEILPLVFERHLRSPGSRGGGLGLALVREIVERAGGEVSAGTARGEEGPVFQVVLQLR